MREYLFHGKCRDEDKWVEGCLIRYGDYCCILQDEDKLHPIDVPYLNDLGCIDGYATPVVPESVGEWTGMCDKNGRKIFEGDIVRTQPYSDRPYSEKAKFKEHIGAVKHYVRHFKNSLYEQDYEAQWVVDIKDLGKYVYCDWNSFFKCEVIGTVFENSDLLEG